MNIPVLIFVRIQKVYFLIFLEIYNEEFLNKYFDIKLIFCLFLLLFFGNAFLFLKKKNFIKFYGKRLIFKLKYIRLFYFKNTLEPDTDV